VSSSQSFAIDPGGSRYGTAQLQVALDNLEALLTAAEMSLANIVRLNAYTTAIDELFKHWARIPQRFGGEEFQLWIRPHDEHSDA